MAVIAAALAVVALGLGSGSGDATLNPRPAPRVSRRSDPVTAPLFGTIPVADSVLVP